MGATVYLATYGCQMNVLDSELVRGQFEALGYAFVDAPADADVVLLNTCSVRELSEQKVWSQLGRLAPTGDGPAPVVGVLGCMAEREGAGFFRRMPHVDLVCGPSELDRLPAMVAAARAARGGQHLALAGHTSRRSSTLARAQDGVESLDLSRAFRPEAGRAQAYVRITRGCNKFCAFCIVPFVRGPEVHRPPGEIVREVRRLVEAGMREITLIGQTVNHYVHTDGGRTTSFADLLVQVHDQVPELPRLRFVTSYPRDFGDDALDAMAACPRICRYLHIPAQSGANGVLKRMNRGYTVETYLDLLARARARMPDICLAGDMIVGFSGETDADHEASLALLAAARYKSCFVFKYSPRPGTVAARRLADDVPDAVKKARNQSLLAAQAAVSLAEHRRKIGQVHPVLVESQARLRSAPAATTSTAPGAVQPAWVQRRARATAAAPPDHVRLIGRTGGDEIVAFDGPARLVGELVAVRVVDATALTLLGDPVAEPAAFAQPAGEGDPAAARAPTARAAAS